MKAVLFGILLLCGLGITLYKRMLAKKRLGEVDRGERCLACDGVQMQRQGPIARCLLCGHSYNAPQMAWVAAGREASELAVVDGSTSLDAPD